MQQLFNAPMQNDRPVELASSFRRLGATLYHADFLEASEEWPSPTVIIVDGPYGVGSFPGDPVSHEALPDWYRPHIVRWSERALPETTLWFWNTEIGWASVHPILVENGWEYRSCHIWDKGIGHIAGNANSKTLRRFPVVTEVCAQYVRKVKVGGARGPAMSLKEWLRAEWERSGLPLYKANAACGVKNAATRKYLTKCHLWYFPPPEAFELLARYANRHGRQNGRPYYSLDGVKPMTAGEWSHMRAKFHCDVGITNVWREPAVRGGERIKNAYKCVHMNQKPLRLLEQIIMASSDPGDVVWEPFGGLCSVAIAAANTGRECHSAEILLDYFTAARERLAYHATP
ncbi:MAG: DNA methyltransferase [Chloroflexota bacterium]|nr:DNA methyltransferase [Chloroflexota bacterium]MDE2685018.1 DNA methyltransferase [Chloroflexota bacterium]